MKKLIGVIVLSALTVAGCDRSGEQVQQPSTNAAVAADTVYTNGKIYTVNEAQPWVEAVAIKDGKFIAVGSADDIAAVTGRGYRSH